MTMEQVKSFNERYRDEIKIQKKKPSAKKITKTEKENRIYNKKLKKYLVKNPIKPLHEKMSLEYEALYIKNSIKVEKERDIKLEKIMWGCGKHNVEMDIYTDGTHDKLKRKKLWNILWNKNNRDWRRNYQSERFKTDPLYKLRCNISSRTSSAFKCKGIPKTKTTQKMLGCTYEFLRDHLAAQFTEGMTLENYGEWAIDHIVPISLGETEEEIIELAHYKNLQPLWADDNLSKGNRIIMSHISKDNRIRYKKFLNR